MMAGGQSINDRLTAARYSIAGQGLAKSVCKATTEEVIGPKKKHLDYLLHCTNEPNVSIPQLANLLIERTGHSSWVVVFKALVTVHHLMCYGNERFTQYLASSNSSFQLSNFLDKSNVQGYDMSTFIRRYAKYLNEKALSYRTVAFDFCKIKRGKDDGILRTMNADKLLKTLPVLQSQIDALLEFDCTANELTNGIINSAFMLLFRDLIRLFACYNDGIINLLEKYFDMNKKMCRDALDIYKKFLIRMDRVAEFLKVAENVGIDKGDIPDLAKAPSSLLDALEQHLTALEGKKGSGAGTPTQPTVKPSYLNSAVTVLSNTSSSFGSAAAGGRSEFNGIGMDDTVKKFALEEEQAALTQHRERRLKELAAQSPTEMPSGTAANATNPFLTSPTSQEPVLDIFDSLPTSSPSAKTSDDLLCLKSNPFAESIIDTSQAPPSSPFPNDFWGNQNGFTVSNAELPTSISSSNMFVSETAFDTVFGNSNSNASTSGPTLTPVPAPEITVEQDVGRSGLDIPGLNPFANISSATPSPSGAPEVRGAGTTPILGGSDLPMFGTPFGEGGVEAQKTGEEPESQSKTVDLKSSPVQSAPSSNFFPDFDSGFGGQIESSSVNQPFSQSMPAGGTAKPGSQADLFGDIGRDFNLGPTSTSGTSHSISNQQQQSTSFGGFDFGMNVLPPVPPNLRTSATPSPSVSGVPSPARSVPTASALDDLNATIRAAMSGSPSRSVSAAGTPSAASDGGKTDMGAFFSQPISLLPATSLPASNIDSGFGGGSPAKAAGSSALGTGFDALGDVLQPVTSNAQSSNQNNQGKGTGTGKVITGDLDSSLAILAQNLDINRGASSMQKGGHVWNSPKNTTKTGGANWTPHIASATATWNSPQHNFKPMTAMSGTSTAPAGKSTDWSSGITSAFPPMSSAPMMQHQSAQFMGGPRAMATAPNVNVSSGGMGMGMPVGVPLGGMVQGQQPMFSSMHPTQSATFGAPPPQQQSQSTTLDPFGVL